MLLFRLILESSPISITHNGAVLIELNIEDAIQAVVPVVPSTEERHKPPPKMIKIPHPIFFSIQMNKMTL